MTNRENRSGSTDDEDLREVQVAVSFSGTVTVAVPSCVPERRREFLASAVALSRVLATLENPDGPDDAASLDYGDRFGLEDAQVEKDWDACRVRDLVGTWSVPPSEPLENSA